MVVAPRTLLATGLLAGFLTNSVYATVTCTTETINAFANPSFESGDLTDWTAQQATRAASNGEVVSGNAADGSDY